MSILKGYKTYIGASIVILGVILKFLGVELGTDAVVIENNLIELFGAIVAIYGRYKANESKGD